MAKKNQDQSTFSPDEFKKLQAKYDDLHKSYLRLSADFDNFRKRIEKEKKHIISAANSDLIKQIFPILDNFRRSAEHTPNIEISDQGIPPLNEEEFTRIHAYFEGMRQIEKQLEQILANGGLKRIETIGHKFNPHTMEAVSCESHPELPEEYIIDEVEGGYKLEDKVIRPAKVRVSKGK